MSIKLGFNFCTLLLVWAWPDLVKLLDAFRAQNFINFTELKSA